MVRLLAVFAALLLPTLANATTGLEWKWEQDQVRRYAITAEVSMPEVLLFRAQNNYDVRVPQFSVELNLSCKAVVPAGKNAWELACTYEDVALHAKPVRVDRGQLLAVLDEMDQNYKLIEEETQEYYIEFLRKWKEVAKQRILQYRKNTESLSQEKERIEKEKNAEIDSLVMQRNKLLKEKKDILEQNNKSITDRDNEMENQRI